MKNFLEDRDGHEEARFPGFCIPTSMTSENGVRKCDLGGKLFTTNEPAVIAKPFPNAIVVDGGHNDRHLAYTSSTDKSEGNEIFRTANDLLDQLARPKKILGGGGGDSPSFLGSNEISNTLIVHPANLDQACALGSS